MASGRFASVDEVMDRLERTVEKAAIAFVLELDKQLRRGTPVATGHARRNWIPSVTAPSQVEATDDAEHAAGVARAVQYKLRDGSLWVSNVVSYIRRLNNGWSKKKPAGFIERAIDLALQKVEGMFGAGAIGFSRSEFQDEVGSEGAENLASAYSPFGDE